MKIVVVGGVAGGAGVAARARRIDETAEIVMFERGEHLSFSNCCLPFALSGIVDKSDKLVLMTPEGFWEKYRIKALVKHEVTEILPDKKEVKVKNLLTGECFTESYDKLALAPGANAILPASIKGIDRENVFVLKNVSDIKKIEVFVSEKKVKKISVVGGGFIGLEVAENFRAAGKEVSLVEGLSRVLKPLDEEMAQFLHKELLDNGIQLYLGKTVSEIGEGEVVLSSGERLPAEAVIMAIGVSPETKLAKDCGIELGQTGGILVNYNYQTNYPDIYAVGDAIELTNRLSHDKSRLPLAGPAQRQARAAADHMFGETHSNRGVIGSSCLHLFKLNVANTGLNEKDCKEHGYHYDFAYTLSTDKVGLMPDAHPLFFKLIFEKPIGRILGAQAVGKGSADKRIDVIAAMISMNATLEDLKELELCYSPHYSTARDVVNQAALVALNLLHGKFRQVPVYKVRELVESKACIIDVREEKEFARGHLIHAVNIPMSQFRERLSEIPRDVPVYLHCRSSQRSYNVICALQKLGYTNLYNISGSFLGISFYEYYRDKTEGRKPIVTEYNFN